jgi:hypothetical protein
MTRTAYDPPVTDTHGEGLLVVRARRADSSAARGERLDGRSGRDLVDAFGSAHLGSRVVAPIAFSTILPGT